ncbi:MAG TPA: tail fiber protein [Pyrinomonadaceae bacterium]|nr:tail fiber protein [Pyrinomonadaceae bacterium]
MSQPYIGEIRMFGGSFAPAGWAMCNGQLIPISENDALFTLIGTTYGGDGQETFALPNLQSRFPVHQGQGPGISNNYILGEAAGVESVTLTTQQIPIHTHPAMCSSVAGTGSDPAGGVWATSDTTQYLTGGSPNTNMASMPTTPMGGSQPHDNMTPYLVVTFIISLFGTFPSQN